MKKFLISLLLLSSPAFAKTVTVEALSDFTTENPSKTLNVKLLDEITLDKDLTLQNGYTVIGEIVDVKDPKRLKRDATFSFIPVSYIDNSGVTVEIKGYYPAKYTTKANKKEIAKSAALSVGNHFVQGLSMGYRAVEGAVKNEKDNRLKSSANAVYENSPFSYVEKGTEIVIKKEQNFYLNFKVNDDYKDEPNYEYEELESSENVI